MSTQGPLPTVDAGSILQEESKRALQALLPTSQYIFRDERMDDYGVDGSLELLVDRQATNIRAQVQLKGRSNTQQNKDGAIAVQVKTANLNYLLNGICPLYILFRPETGELRFAFAREEWARLERENIPWRNQQWITLHFHHILTPASLVEIRSAILAEAKVRRAVDEQLKKLQSATGHTVVIDAQSLNITDSQQILDALVRIGQTLTHSGLARLVIEKARLIPSSLLLAAPRAALAVAYAHFHLSHYYDAAASIRQLLLTDPALDAESRSLLDVLFVSARRMMGEIDEEHYERAMESWLTTAPPELAAQYEISRAWSAYTKAMPHLPTDQVRKQARDVMRAALDRGRKLNNQHLLDYVELLDLTLAQHEVSDAALDAKALQSISAIGEGDAHFAREVARAAGDSMRRWASALEQLAIRTRDSAPHTYCGVLLLRNFAALEQQRQLRYSAWFRGEREIRAGGEVIRAARDALQLARALEDRDLELSSMLALAETLDTCGDESEATAVAQETLRIAELVGIERHARQARRFLQGDDRTEARRRLIMEFAASSEEEILRRAGDDQVLFMATTMVTVNRLPQSRIPNVAYSLMCQRQLARERRDWCRHIALAEFRKYHESPVTLYAERPLLRVVCMKLDQSSLVESREPQQVSAAFRDSYCRGCAHRVPETPARTDTNAGATGKGQAARNRAKAARRNRRRLGRR